MLALTGARDGLLADKTGISHQLFSKVRNNNRAISGTEHAFTVAKAIIQMDKDLANDVGAILATVDQYYSRMDLQMHISKGSIEPEKLIYADRHLNGLSKRAYGASVDMDESIFLYYETGKKPIKYLEAVKIATRFGDKGSNTYYSAVSLLTGTVKNIDIKKQNELLEEVSNRKRLFSDLMGELVSQYQIPKETLDKETGLSTGTTAKLLKGAFLTDQKRAAKLGERFGFDGERLQKFTDSSMNKQQAYDSGVLISLREEDISPSQALIKLREQQGKTKKEVAKEVGFDHNHMTYIEKLGKIPSDYIQGFIKALSIPAEDQFRFQDSFEVNQSLSSLKKEAREMNGSYANQMLEQETSNFFDKRVR